MSLLVCCKDCRKLKKQSDRNRWDCTDSKRKNRMKNLTNAQILMSRRCKKHILKRGFKLWRI